MNIQETDFGISTQARYIASVRGHELSIHYPPGITKASESETEKREGLLVNPVLITLLQRQGEVDCGGLDHLWDCYGHFWTGLIPMAWGHRNVGLETDAIPTDLIRPVREALQSNGHAC